MTRKHTLNKGGLVVEGGPMEIAGALSERVITPAAQAILAECRLEGLAAFYTTLTIRVVTTIAVVLGADVARRIAHVATDHIDAAIAEAAKHRPGVH